MAAGGYRMIPRLMVGYKIRFMGADQYDNDGYVGQFQDCVATLDGREKWAGAFTVIDGWGQNPPPPNP